MADNTEIDSSAEPQIEPRDRVVQRLVEFGVPEEQLDQPGLVVFVKNNEFLIPELVSIILPKDEEVAEALHNAKLGSKSAGLTMKDQFHECMTWLQWLMFEGDPSSALRKLSRMSVGQRGVCGAVWGLNDIAYRCRTCEHDPTCAICVPCFENGDHKDHDYLTIYTGGGCCDCGDATAWKREGFCSNHKGAEQIQPLPEKYANSVTPVLSSLFNCWKDKLKLAEIISEEKTRPMNSVPEGNVANELTFVVVEMLLEFCKQSESLLSYVARLLFSCTDLLAILLRSERFLVDGVVKKLHELLLKLLGEPTFKYEFAKVFLNYYPSVISEAIKECKDLPPKKYPLLSTFSVQILTVPTLTPRLLKEINLLAMLFTCLEKIFISCAGEDGRLQAAKWGNLYETTIRVIEDLRFVMSHVVVPKCVTCDQRHISRTWMKLLSFVQGMSPLKRETGLQIEDENENVHLPFFLGHFIANIHSVLVDGAFSDACNSGGMDDEIVWNGDNLRHTKIGRLSQESSACSPTNRNSTFACSSKVSEIRSESSNPSLPHFVTSLICECLRAIENWLEVDNTSGVLTNVLSSNRGSIHDSNFAAFKRTLSNIGRGKYIFGRPASSSKEHGRQSSDFCIVDLENCKDVVKDDKLIKSGDSDTDNTYICSKFEDSAMETELPLELDSLHFLSLSDWPQIVYDVSSQDISVHIPLHRLLSMLLQRALRRLFSESAVSDIGSCSTNSVSTICTDFFGHALGGTHPYGFSAFVMEHPLRIRVFCAEVHAGMWRKNGDAALLSCELYRSEQELELDLFLLQCCAALAPADPYVIRILERFGLSNYLSLNFERSSEYEPVLVQEMLTLIIQIVKERRFAGLTTAESLKRELIYKLAIGNATHSQLVKSLPRDLSEFEHLQDILDTVAAYSNPSGFTQGMYSLRWQMWKELDLYHPRWHSKDLQVAEERYLRFCSVSALTKQLPCWTKIYSPLKAVARIGTCKMVLQIIRAVLFYAVLPFESAESRAPFGVLLTALHLLSLSLDICFHQKEFGWKTCFDGEQIPILAFAGETIDESSYHDIGEQSLLSLLVLLMGLHRNEEIGNSVEAGSCSLSALIESLLKKFAEIDDKCKAKLQQLAPEVVSHTTEIIPIRDSVVSRSASDSEKHKAKARERQAAILEKMRAQQLKFMASVDSTADDGPQVGHEEDSDAGHDAKESSQVVCSLCHDHDSKHPISFFILLQKSRLVSFVNQGPPSWAQLYQSDKEYTLIAKNKMTVTDTAVMNWASGNSESTCQSAQLLENAANESASVGQQGEVNGFLRYLKDHFPAWGNVQVPETSYDKGEIRTCTFETLEQCMYSSICRAMQDNVPCHLMKEDEKISSDGVNSSKTRDAELSLLRKCVADFPGEMENTSVSGSASTENASVESCSHPSSYNGFGPADCDGVHLSSCGHAVHQGCLDRYLTSLKERSVRRMIFEGGHIVDPDQGEFLCPVCRRLVNCVLPTLPGDLPNPFKQHMSSVSLAASHEGTYSLRLQGALLLLQSSANAVVKDEFLKAVPLQQSDKTESNLERLSRVLSKMYFPGKHEKVSGYSRVNHSILMWDTLMYSLISMEIASRCGRTSLTPNYALDAMYEELKSSSGFVLSLLLKLVQRTRSRNSLHVLHRFRGVQLFAESLCSGVSLSCANGLSKRGADIKLWSRAADPVLAHDPFSTLMWVLFCLPFPFLSSEESLLCLVHAFYIVALTQAIILYCGKSQHKLWESDLSDTLVTDIYKVTSKSGCFQQYFMSNYFDPNVDIKPAIQRFCFPYLRRCALLWKMLFSSIPAPFGDTEYLDRSWKVSDMMDDSNTDMFELTKYQELENLFMIPSVDVVLKDEVSRSSVHAWLHHFCKEYELRRIQCNMLVTPAVPFELMQLPHVYLDLLQRCIKKRCSACKTLLDEPALCLLCGRLCSPSWKSCCRESGCQNHATVCGAGTGVFLLIKRTTILLQRSARQAPWPSPYLDEFGEEDYDMHRGKPLYLNEERYAALTYMVASHGLDRSSKVLSLTTMGSIFLV